MDRIIEPSPIQPIDRIDEIRNDKRGYADRRLAVMNSLIPRLPNRRGTQGISFYDWAVAEKKEIEKAPEKYAEKEIERIERERERQAERERELEREREEREAEREEPEVSR